MSRNDITGDSLVSKAATEEYRAGLERIFGVKQPWYMRRDNERAVERCPGCEACINSACGRDECPKGWPKATKD